MVEAFHASVEVKGPEEVTVERLLERVLPFFVVDHQEYSVQWPLAPPWAHGPGAVLHFLGGRLYRMYLI